MLYCTDSVSKGGGGGGNINDIISTKSSSSKSNKSKDDFNIVDKNNIAQIFKFDTESNRIMEVEVNILFLQRMNDLSLERINLSSSNE